MPVDALVCPHCRCALTSGGAAATDVVLRCSGCARTYPVDDGIADFAEGNYYDEFDETSVIPDEHAAGLALEEMGTRARISRFYEPLVRSRAGERARVLDLGCGNGLAVDVFAAGGIDAWGADLSALRKWQWKQRVRRERLVVANALRTPFADGYFDVVISSGVLEHIGVEERGGESYSVRPLPERDALREAFCAEVFRITKPGGVIFLDFPNGSFPVDFWHSNATGGARVHALSEGFLPKYGEVARYFSSLGADVRVKPLSPHGRLQCQQVRRHWYGRAFWLPVRLWLAALALRPFRFLAASPLNPFLVIEIRKGR